MATDEQDVIQAQEALQEEQNLLTQAQQQQSADPTNTNFQRLVDARETNVSVREQQLQETLLEFEQDQGFSFFELEARRQAELEAQLQAQREAEAQRQAELEAQRQAELEAQRQAALQAEADRIAEEERLAELARIEEQQQADTSMFEEPAPAPEPTQDFGGLPPAEVPTADPIDVIIPDTQLPAPDESALGTDVIDQNIGIGESDVLDQNLMPEPEPVQRTDQELLGPLFRPRVSQQDIFGTFNRVSAFGEPRRTRRTRPIQQAVAPESLGGFDISVGQQQSEFDRFSNLFTRESLTGITRRREERQQTRKTGKKRRTTQQRRRERVVERRLTPDDIFRF